MKPAWALAPLLLAAPVRSEGGVEAARGMLGPMLLGLVPVAAREDGEVEIQFLAGLGISDKGGSSLLVKGSRVMGETYGAALHWRFARRLGLAVLTAGGVTKGVEPPDGSGSSPAGRYFGWGFVGAAGASVELLGGRSLRLPVAAALGWWGLQAARGSTSRGPREADGQRGLGAAFGPAARWELGDAALSPFALASVPFQDSDLGRSPAGKLAATVGIDLAFPAADFSLAYAHTHGIHTIGARWGF